MGVSFGASVMRPCVLEEGEEAVSPELFSRGDCFCLLLFPFFLLLADDSDW